MASFCYNKSTIIIATIVLITWHTNAVNVITFKDLIISQNKPKIDFYVHVIVKVNIKPRRKAEHETCTSIV